MDGTDLQGRVAVITGASAGIGEACARRLAGRGMDVVLGARRAGRLEALGRELADAHGVRVLPVALDVTDRNACEAFHAAASEFAGAAGVHVLVNNAGLGLGMATLREADAEDEDDWIRMFDTNVMGVLRTTRLFLAGLVERGEGLIVNLGSMAAIEAYAGGAVYCATKAAVRSISRALRLELIGSGVRLTTIHPGMVETEFSVVRFDGDRQAAAAVYAGMTPLTGDHIAECVEWVAGLPAVMNIEEIVLMPTDQVSVRTAYRREA